MKRTFAPALALLLITVSGAALAAGADSSALPPGPQMAPAPAQILGLLPEDKTMPPEPLALTNAPSAPAIPVAKVEKAETVPEEKEAPVEVAAVVMPPPVPVKHDRDASRSSLPFPPSAEDWSARMSLGTAAIPPPAIMPQQEGQERDDAAPAVSTPVPKPVIHRGFSRTPMQNAAIDENDTNDDRSSDAPEARIVHRVYSSSGACRAYTRTVDGQRLSGTACQDHNGVWRIAEEHRYTQMRVARVYHVGPPQRASSPSLWPTLQQATSLTTFGLAIGNLWRVR